MQASHVTLIPRISEQTFALAETGFYVFDVPKTATKQMIKAAVEKQFEVTVLTVNVSVLKGKKKPSLRKRVQARYGSRTNTKKAYVKLKQGDKIAVFEEIQ